MSRAHVKKNDTVVVISGADKGKAGRLLSADREKGRVVVEGVNVRKKTVRRSQEHPQGGIIELECSIHISNVMLQEKYEARKAARPETEAASSGAPEEAEAPSSDTSDDAEAQG